MPKFNTDTPRARQYLLDVGRYWIEQGADGWRLDVPNEINDDAFWAEFRHTVRSANPEAYLVGEIWDALPRWVGDGHFDGLMNYPFRTATLGLLGANWTPERYIPFLAELTRAYPLENSLAMYTLLGSHDVERVKTMLGGNSAKVKLASLLQFGYLGAPAVYYGDEIGLEGGKDPGCRGGFPWDEKYWDHDLRGWLQKLALVRKSTAALRRGDFQAVYANDGEKVVAFARRFAGETVIVAANASHTQRTALLPAGSEAASAHNLLNGELYPVQQGQIHITLPAWGGVWLQMRG